MGWAGSWDGDQGLSKAGFERASGGEEGLCHRSLHAKCMTF